MNIHAFISEKIHQAFIAAGAPETCKIKLQQSTKANFGDYQANGIMTIHKSLGISSLKLAQKVVSFIELDGIARKIEIADPGFINIFLDSKWLSEQLINALYSSKLGVSPVLSKTIVVDYSSPNLAKEMHVGHVRSTIIGDSMVRTLEFLGHHVIRANHIGDWGTQFGMLIAYLKKNKFDVEKDIHISCLERFYREAKTHYDSNPTFAEFSRNCVVKLQDGNDYCHKIWKKLVDITMIKNQKIYDRLNVTLTHNDIMGESLYKNMLPEIVKDLKNKGLAVRSQGAIVVFLNEFLNKKGESMGVIIQKRDGAYLYTTTDIACAKYRCETLKADRVIYYVDSRQKKHLTQSWMIAKKAGYISKSILFEHHMFGMILNKNGQPFKTRSGKTIKLNDLLDEALKRARLLILKKNPCINEDELEKLSQIIGIGALKYSDLSKNRITDYYFDWDSMLRFEGNTAPYVQYAYTRILSIFKRSGKDENYLNREILLESDQEIQLSVRLLQYEEVIHTVARDGTPHILCTYLYNLAVLFSSFYECCSILNSKNEKLYNSRLQLALLTSKTLKQGLNLLGIETAERM